MPRTYRRRLRRLSGALALLSSLALPWATSAAASTQTDDSVRLPDCRYERVPTDSPQAHQQLFMPDNDLFTPPLADVKEPRFSFSYRRVNFSHQALPSGGAQDTINAGLVSAGGIFGVWGLRPVHGCDGVQISLIGGVFSQFNLDAPSSDLINSDFIVGTQVSAREGNLSGRVRLYHQSSHLGDEFLLRNPSIVRTDFGFQRIDGLVAYDAAWWRVYGGGGYVFFTDDGLDPLLLQGGIEAHGRKHDGSRYHPLVGVDVDSLQARNWEVTTSVAAGLEWTSRAATRRMRALVVYLDGFIPFGQFSNQQELRNIGLQLQIEF